MTRDYGWRPHRRLRPSNHGHGRAAGGSARRPSRRRRLERRAARRVRPGPGPYFFPRSRWFFASALACFSARFSLIDLVGFLAMCCRGDLSAMRCSQREGTWTAPSTDPTRTRAGGSGVVVLVGVVGGALVPLTGAEQGLELGLGVGRGDEEQLVERLERVVAARRDR